MTTTYRAAIAYRASGITYRGVPVGTPVAVTPGARVSRRYLPLRRARSVQTTA